MENLLVNNYYYFCKQMIIIIRIKYQSLTREMGPQSLPEKTAGCMDKTLLISTNQKLAIQIEQAA